MPLPNEIDIELSLQGGFKCSPDSNKEPKKESLQNLKLRRQESTDSFFWS